MLRFGILALFAMSLVVSAPLPAQDLSKMFREIDRVSLFGRIGGFAPDDGYTATNDKSFSRFGNAGMGLELGYNIGPTDGAWIFEGGVGYSQTGGFRLERSDIDFRGTLRELPSVSFYAIRNVKVMGAVPYFGVTSGFIKLQNSSIYDASGAQYSVSADAFTLGSSVGLAFGGRMFSPYLEAGYRVRQFPSVEYKFGSSTTVPSTWPRSINLSGWNVEFGMQVGLDELKKQKQAGS